MTTFTGTQRVNGGYYLNTRDWKLEVIDRPSGVLPGDEHARYARIPALAMLILGPLMGMAFVILLPFIGLFVVAEQGWAKLAPRLHVTRRSAATAMAESAPDLPR